jgi:FMN phosphatase YigB (HAD superfamily)
MIGNDYKKDMESAKIIGMHTVPISNQRSDFPNADYVITDFSDLSFLP